MLLYNKVDEEKTETETKVRCVTSGLWRPWCLWHLRRQWRSRVKGDAAPGLGTIWSHNSYMFPALSLGSAVARSDDSSSVRLLMFTFLFHCRAEFLMQLIKASKLIALTPLSLCIAARHFTVVWRLQGDDSVRPTGLHLQRDSAEAAARALREARRRLSSVQTRGVSDDVVRGSSCETLLIAHKTGSLCVMCVIAELQFYCRLFLGCSVYFYRKKHIRP